MVTLSVPEARSRLSGGSLPAARVRCLRRVAVRTSILGVWVVSRQGCGKRGKEKSLELRKQAASAVSLRASVWGKGLGRCWVQMFLRAQSLFPSSYYVFGVPYFLSPSGFRRSLSFKTGLFPYSRRAQALAQPGKPLLSTAIGQYQLLTKLFPRGQLAIDHAICV